MPSLFLFLPSNLLPLHVRSQESLDASSQDAEEGRKEWKMNQDWPTEKDSTVINLGLFYM